MAENQIEEVKNKTDIVSLISEYIEVKKAGRNYKANCPFHGEKTPSFMVTPELQMYKCFGCFPAGQFVKTPFGAHEIQNVVEGEHVMSGKGNLQKVLVRHEREYVGNMITIILSQFSEPVNLTEDHIVYIVGGAKTYRNRYKYLSRRLNFFSKNYSHEKELQKMWKYFPLEEIRAGQLKKGMSVLYPINYSTQDIFKLDLSEYITKIWPKHGKKPLIPELEVNVDENLLKLIGYYIVEGSSHRAYMRFSVGDHEIDFSRDISNIVKELFNLDAQICRKHKGKKSGTEISICNSILSNVFENLCGKGAENKHIPFIFQYLPIKKQQILLDAIFRGDGYTDKIRNTKKTARKNITTISRTLSEQLVDILLRNGFYPSKYVKNEYVDKNNIKHRNAFTVGWSTNPKASKFHHSYQTKDGIYYRILPIVDSYSNNFSGKVYNLTVENDHSYVSNNFSVSNCGRHGDVFTFLEEHEGMEFSESLKYLAEKAGVTLTLIKNDESSEKEKIIEINKSTLNFYNYALHDHPQGKRVLEYLKVTRGLSDESIKRFKIGYSPESYDALANYLIQKKKLNKNDLEKAGLLVGRGIDRFRGRVIFPLTDHRENIVGFAGRILPWAMQDMAKYINSPDTPAYHKSHVLYGMDITKSEIRDKKYAVIVEGELDMISSYQAGIRNVIAIKGSALTEDQLRLIGRFCQKIVLCLDSDFAGDEAAKRGSILAVNMGFEVKVAHLVGHKDPDEISRKDPDAYLKYIEEAVDIWEFLINTIFNKYNSGTGSEKSSISKEVIPLLRLIQDNIVQSFYIENVARRLSVPIDSVYSEVKKSEVNNLNTPVNNSYTKKEKSRRQMLEEKLLVLLIRNDQKLILEEDIKNLFSDPFTKKIIEYLEVKGFPLPPELEEKYAEMVLENSDDDMVETVKKELISLDLRQKLSDLGNKIKQNESDEVLLKEFSNLSKKLSTL